jgi:quercetin dioxygenase-like cupin family protein/hemerythrin-like domain-containing protein
VRRRWDTERVCALERFVHRIAVNNSVEYSSVKRHPSLVPLSHDHHHALVEARRLRRAADAGDAERRQAAAGFLRFFSTETIRHFRQEEEQLFPVLVGDDGKADDLLVQALVEHQRIHALVGRLQDEVSAGGGDSSTMRELGELLDAHARLEERRLFPLIEQVVGGEALSDLDLATGEELAVLDLFEARGTGPLWGTETDDLNATLLAWPAGGGRPEQVNNERDVIVVVLAGSATVTIDGDAHAVHAGDALVGEKGRRPSFSAGPDGSLLVHPSAPRAAADRVAPLGRALAASKVGLIRN